VLEGLFQPLHMLLILGVVLIVFGPGKLPEIGENLGKSIRGFKKALDEGGEAPSSPPPRDQPPSSLPGVGEAAGAGDPTGRPCS
jgi:sec-independent protein translocase protein TatA